MGDGVEGEAADAEEGAEAPEGEEEDEREGGVVAVSGGLLWGGEGGSRDEVEEEGRVHGDARGVEASG